MTVPSSSNEEAPSTSKKLMKYFVLSLFAPRFSSSKCKTAAKMAVARIKLLRNKREVTVRQMRRDIALLLQCRQDATARVRVEHVIREQNVLAANEFVELFCELIVSRLTIISKQRECPADLKEGIASLIFAAPRCAEIPELGALVKIFEKKYGKDFVSAATDLRPACGVNRILIDKLSVRTPTGEVKLKVLKEIAKEHQIDWDATESEKELLKAPEERIEGPNTFSSASSASSVAAKPAETKTYATNQPFVRSSLNDGATGNKQFHDTVSAAEAAAESAKQAIAAAQAAAHLANKHFDPATCQAPGFETKMNTGYGMPSVNSMGVSVPNDRPINYQVMHHNSQNPSHEPQNFNGLDYASNVEKKSVQMDGEDVYRRHSYNGSRPNQMDGHNYVYRRHSYNASSPNQMDEHNIQRRYSFNTSSPNSEIKFDESDYDEEIETEEGSPEGMHAPPPMRPPPPVPTTRVNSVHQVHPKLPDYDSLAARFEALRKSQS